MHPAETKVLIKVHAALEKALKRLSEVEQTFTVEEAIQEVLHARKLVTFLLEE